MKEIFINHPKLGKISLDALEASLDQLDITPVNYLLGSSIRILIDEIRKRQAHIEAMEKVHPIKKMEDVEEMLYLEELAGQVSRC